MKHKYLLVLLAGFIFCVTAYPQKVEKKIIRARATVTLPLTESANAVLLKDLNKDNLLELVNKYSSSRAGGFLNWKKSPLTKDSLKNSVVVVLSNINPQHLELIAKLREQEVKIQTYTDRISSEANRYLGMSDIPFKSATNANARILLELKTLQQENGTGSYQKIQDKIFEEIDPDKTATDPEIEKITDKIKVLQETREMVIEKYKSLHQWIFNISERANLVILHSGDGEDWDDDPTGCRKILIVVINGDNKLDAASFYAENFKSGVAIEFNELIKFIKAAGIISMGKSVAGVPIPPIAADITFLEVEKSKIDPPGNIVALVPYKEDGKIKNDTIKVKIKEKINVSFRVGVSTALIDRKIFKIENKQLIINLDSAQKEEWKQHFVVTFNLNPWYRTGDYSPKMFRYDKDNSILKRFSLFTGMNLSLTPLDNIYLGAAYDLSKNFTINAGCTWNNTRESRAIDIGDIDSVKDALKLSNKKYGDAKWFFALTFRPAILSEILGLGKDDGN